MTTSSSPSTQSVVGAGSAQELRLRRILDVASDGIVVFDRSFSVTELNPAAERIFSTERGAAVGQPLGLLLPEAGFERLQQAALALASGLGQGQGLEIPGKRNGGDDFTLEVQLSMLETPDGGEFVAFVRDVSTTKHLEVELRHAQKLEAVGRLAAGIAHEINTPIQFIGDSARFVKTAFEDVRDLIEALQGICQDLVAGNPRPNLAGDVHKAVDDADWEYLQEQIPKAIDRTLDGVQRVAKIVRAMKDFAYPDRQEMAPADINKAISSTITVATNELKYHCDVVTEFGDIPSVICHVGDLNQVWLNMLVNAAHAIEDVVNETGEKGTITVRTSSDDTHVTVSISDTGTGIPLEHQEKIFEPFFTSKEVGKGTGQGLAIARNIVIDKHGGTLNFETAMGQGTTFIIRLPIEGNEKKQEGQ